MQVWKKQRHRTKHWHKVVKYFLKEKQFDYFSFKRWSSHVFTNLESSAIVFSSEILSMKKKPVILAFLGLFWFSNENSFGTDKRTQIVWKKIVIHRIRGFVKTLDIKYVFTKHLFDCSNNLNIPFSQINSLNCMCMEIRMFPQKRFHPIVIGQ